MKIQVEILGLPHGNTLHLEKHCPLLFFCCLLGRLSATSASVGKVVLKGVQEIRLVSRTKEEEEKNTIDADTDLICLQKL